MKVVYIKEKYCENIETEKIQGNAVKLNFRVALDVSGKKEDGQHGLPA